MMILLQVVLGLLILGVLVLVHELGHFVAAKSFKIKVLAFSIGFGKPLINKKVGETEYRICAIPFGGYIQMSGEHPEDKPIVEPGDFTSKPIWQRAVVAIAGPLSNVIFAMICLYIVFIMGITTPMYLSRPVIGSVAQNSSAEKAGFLPGDSIMAINGKIVSSWENIQNQLAYQLPQNNIVFTRGSSVNTLNLSLPKLNTSKIPKDPTGGLQPCLPPIIGLVNSGSAGDKAKLAPFDTVVSINSKPIHSWYELSSTVTAYDSTRGPLLFIVKRGAALVNSPVAPVYNKDAGRFLVGISMAQPPSRQIKYSPLEAIPKMLDKTKEYTVMIFDVLAKLFSKQVSPKQLAGPIGIVQMSGVMALSGLGPVLDFMALIGINLGVLNLMPLIITDGGLLLFLLIEGVRRKPLSIKMQLTINRVAISFFILLFLYVTFNDIVRVPDLIKMFGR